MSIFDHAFVPGYDPAYCAQCEGAGIDHATPPSPSEESERPLEDARWDKLADLVEPDYDEASAAQQNRINPALRDYILALAAERDLYHRQLLDALGRLSQYGEDAPIKSQWEVGFEKLLARAEQAEARVKLLERVLAAAKTTDISLESLNELDAAIAACEATTPK